MNPYRLRVNIKIGDKQPIGSPKRNLSILDGYVVDWQCDCGDNPYWAESDKQSGTSRAYGILETTVSPEDWSTVEGILRLAVKSNKAADRDNYRARCALVNLRQVEQTLFQPGLEAAWRSRSCIPAIMIDDWSKLVGLFKSTDALNAPAIDVNQVAQGTYTVGPAPGDDFATLSLAFADIANFTNDLTFAQNGDVTETGSAVITENLGGFTFTIMNNKWHYGNTTSGYSLTINHADDQFDVQCEGPGSVVIEQTRFVRGFAAASSSRAAILIRLISVEFTAYIQRNIYDGNGNSGAFLYCQDATPILYTIANLGFEGYYGIYIGVGNAANIYENDEFYNNTGYGFRLDGQPGTFRREVSFNNTSADYVNHASADAYYCFSSDATATNSNWNVGVGNQINGDPSVAFESVLPADGNSFLRPEAGGVLDTDYATALSSNTTDIAGILWASGGWYIGVKTHLIVIVYGIAIASITPSTSGVLGGATGVIIGKNFATSGNVFTIDGNAVTLLTESTTVCTFQFPVDTVGSYTALLTHPTNDTSDSVTVTYEEPGTPILTNAEEQLLTLVNGMSVATGYHYDWGNSDQPDEALDAAVNAIIERAEAPFEQNMDDPEGAHAGAYTNAAFYRITVRGELTSEESLPRWAIMAIWNKLSDDLKKRLGSGSGSTLNGYIQHIQYRKADVFMEQAGDRFKPGRMETTWSVLYYQDRIDPSINA